MLGQIGYVVACVTCSLFLGVAVGLVFIGVYGVAA